MIGIVLSPCFRFKPDEDKYGILKVSKISNCLSKMRHKGDNFTKVTILQRNTGDAHSCFNTLYIYIYLV